MTINLHNRVELPRNAKFRTRRIGAKKGRPRKQGKHNPNVHVRRMFFWRQVQREVGQVITRAEAARILGVSHDTIQRRINAGTYRGVKFDDDEKWNWFVSLADVIQDAEESVLASGTFSEINTQKGKSSL